MKIKHSLILDLFFVLPFFDPHQFTCVCAYAADQPGYVFDSLVYSHFPVVVLRKRSASRAEMTSFSEVMLPCFLHSYNHVKALYSNGKSYT